MGSSRRTALAGVALVGVLAIVIVIIASSGGSSGEEEVQPGTPLRPAPAALDAAPGATGREDGGRVAAFYELRVSVLDGSVGQPLPDAQVEVRYRVAGGQPKTYQRATGPSGDVRVPGLPAGAYEITVTRPGYMDSDPVSLAFPGNSGVVAVALQPAARVYGSVQRTSGGGTPGGFVRLTHEESGTVELLAVAKDGGFYSPALERGTWRLEWLPSEHAPADPRITTDVAVAPGKERQVEIFAPEAGATGQDPRVGLQVVDEG